MNAPNSPTAKRPYITPTPSSDPTSSSILTGKPGSGSPSFSFNGPSSLAGPSDISKHRKGSLSPTKRNASGSTTTMTIVQDDDNTRKRLSPVTTTKIRSVSGITGKGKEKEKEKGMVGAGERPSLLREIGSATISLRPGLVDEFGSSDEESAVSHSPLKAAKPATTGRTLSSSNATTSRSDVKKDQSNSVSGLWKEFEGYNISEESKRQQPFSDMKAKTVDKSISGISVETNFDKIERKHNSPTRSSNLRFGKTVKMATSATTATKSNAARFSPSLPSDGPKNRLRSNSVHIPSKPTISPTESYFLSHFSTDREYSLSKEKVKEEGRLNLELGLGEDFDQSFGEALKQGIEGKEMPLPQEALRVLTEAKESLDQMISLKGRKGSIGMGLFKESRPVVKKSKTLNQNLDVLDEKLEKKEKEKRDRSQTVVTGGLKSSKVTSGREEKEQPKTPEKKPVLGIVTAAGLMGSGGKKRNQKEDDDFSETSTGIIVASPALRRFSLKRREREERRNSVGSNRTESKESETSVSSIGSPTKTSPARPQRLGGSVLSLSEDEASIWTTTESDSDAISEQSSTEEDEEGSRLDEGSRDESDFTPDTDDQEEERMTVPLQPFNHAVGGHSSIYKFTRRAVCKPLVSRENLFYEEVERLAPALLAFIPRYLGVMLVNYRRQHRLPSEEPGTPQDPELTARPDQHPTSDLSVPPTPAGTRRPTLHKSASSVTYRDDEVPEVALDWNRHVVPDWLFDNRGRRSRREGSEEESRRPGIGIKSSSHRSIESYVQPGTQSPTGSSIGQGGSLPIPHYLSQSPNLRPTPSTPNLAIPRVIKEHEIDEGLGEIHGGESSPRTPLSSVNASPMGRSRHLHHTVSSPVIPFRSRLDNLFPTSSSTDLGTGTASGYCSPHPWGGTGSTTVNTKLKDHVFATILKRLKKKGLHPVRHHDDIEDADDESESNILQDGSRSVSAAARRRGRAHRRGGSRNREKVSGDGDDGDESGIRRTKSDVVLHRGGRSREESQDRGLFRMDDVDDDDDQLDELQGGPVEVRRSIGNHSLSQAQRGRKSSHQNLLSSLQGLSMTPSMSPSPSTRDSSEKPLSAIATLPPSRLPVPKASTKDRSSLPTTPVPQESSLPGTPTIGGSEEIPNRQELFIFMEDLTGRLKHPCVLDLKMGTRQYGYDATPLKKKSQRKKCDATTSRTLGVRMCGMQVWNQSTQSFVSKNKYRGREVKTSDFSDILRLFLDDGERLLIDHIPPLIQKLHNLASILLKLNGFRFYGCSLLLIYDGDKDVQDHFAKHAKSSRLDLNPPHSRTGSSLSRNNLDIDDQSIHSNPHLHHHHHHARTGPVRIPNSPGRRSRSADHHHHHHNDRDNLKPRTHHHSHSQSHSHHQSHIPHGSSTPSNSRASQHHPSPKPLNHHRIRGEINLRVVDFAHTTTGADLIPMPPGEDTSNLGKGYDAKFDIETGLTLARFPPKHKDKPDMGFIFGLKSVVEALREVWDDEMARRREVISRRTDLTVTNLKQKNERDAESGENAGEEEEEDLEVRELIIMNNENIFEEAFGQEVDMGNLST